MKRIPLSRSLVGVGAALAALAFFAAGRAQANLLANGGFESPVLSVGAAQSFTPGQMLPLAGPGWTVVGNSGTSIFLLQTAYAENFNNVPQFNAQGGANSVDVTGPFNVGSSAGVQQTVSVTPGRGYQLTFWVGRVTPIGGPGGVYPGPATVDLVVDAGPRIPFTNSDSTNGSINWKSFTHTFTATSTQVSIAFLNGTPGGNNLAGLDSVSLEPLPSVPALPGWGVAALAAGFLSATTARARSRQALRSE